jgi:hypothetical protein
MGGGGVVPCFVLLDSLPERRVLFLLFFPLLLLKDGSGFRRCSGSLGGLVPLVKDGAADHSQRRKDYYEQFRVDRVQHLNLPG